MVGRSGHHATRHLVGKSGDVHFTDVGDYDDDDDVDDGVVINVIDEVSLLLGVFCVCVFFFLLLLCFALRKISLRDIMIFIAAQLAFLHRVGCICQ